ncbi:MAG TPA: prepilin peptidase, partial [Patescibacteria group bacterium]
MEILLQAMIFVMGCSLGSFVNMLLYRSAVGEDKQKNKVLKKVSKDGKESRSFCDFCGRQLRWYENIPVISWVIQGGKTKCCGKPLPYSYPAVELVTGILILINFRFQFLGPEVFLNWQFWVALAAETVIITMLVFEAYFDLTYMLLPDFS